MEKYSGILQIIIWPLTALLFGLLFLLVFRNPIIKVIEKRDFHIKKGDTEFDVISKIENQNIIEKQDNIVVESPKELNHESKLLEERIITPDELVSEMVDAFVDGDKEKGEKLYKDIQEKEKDSKKKINNEGLYLYFMYRNGNSDAINKLRELAKQPESSSKINRWIGLCYDSTEEYEKAISEYEIAKKKESDIDERTEIINLLSKSIYNAGRKQEAINLLIRELKPNLTYKNKSIIYTSLADIYEKDKNFEFRALALEKVLENVPNDIDVRFSVAYSYHEINMDSIALLHYKNILRFNSKHSWSLNNIGVAYRSLNMPIKSVKYYKEAAEAGVTLASANLAGPLINDGYVTEASEILNSAKIKEDVHPNVNDALTSINKKEEAETELENKTLEEAREQQRLLRSFSEAFFITPEIIPSFAGTWKDPKGITFEISLNGDQIICIWSEGEKKFQITGNITNRAALIALFSEKYSFITKKNEFNKDEDGKAYLTEDGHIVIIFTIEKDKHTLRQLQKEIIES
jgi:tetratricopeptide (TPR) repeat protein